MSTPPARFNRPLPAPSLLSILSQPSSASPPLYGRPPTLHYHSNISEYCPSCMSRRGPRAAAFWANAPIPRVRAIPLLTPSVTKALFFRHPIQARTPSGCEPRPLFWTETVIRRTFPQSFSLCSIGHHHVAYADQVQRLRSLLDAVCAVLLHQGDATCLTVFQLHDGLRRQQISPRLLALPQHPSTAFLCRLLRHRLHRLSFLSMCASVRCCVPRLTASRE